MTNKHEGEVSFISFLKAKEQRIDWVILAAICIVAYIVMKICYPYPATISDSGTYVHAAAQDMFTFYRPFGYSYLLQIFHLFSSSIHSIFVFQMVIYFMVASAFAFTIKYFFPPANRIVWYVLLALFIINPIMVYMANAIMSDFIFAVTIYLMLISFAFICKKKSWIALGVFLLSFYCSLHIRYSAIIFPVLFICFFFLVKDKIRWVAIVATLFVSIVFYNQMKSNMKEAVGISQYSTGFDGWQLANNGLHVVPFIDLEPKDIRNNQMRELHQFVLQFKDVMLKETDNGTKPVAAFMWRNYLPLKQYLSYYIQAQRLPYPVAWVKIGSGLYKDYGSYLIKNYPWQFMKHYYLPNAKNIFYPDEMELIGGYTVLNVDDIFTWYDIPKNEDVNAKYPIFNKTEFGKSISVFYLIGWIITIGICIAAIVYRKQLKFSKTDTQVLLCVAIFGIIYYTSTVFAGPIMMRFWSSMGGIHFAVVYILLNRIILCRKNNPVTEAL